MDRLHESQTCRPGDDEKKCCKLMEIESGAKVIGVIDILSFIISILALFRIIAPQRMLEPIANVDKIDSSFRLVFLVGSFVFAWRSVVFIRYMSA